MYISDTNHLFFLVKDTTTTTKQKEPRAVQCNHLFFILPGSVTVRMPTKVCKSKACMYIKLDKT